VRPVGEHGTDEALGFPVCLRPVGACAEVFDLQPSAGDRVDDRDVGAAVVAEDRFDRDPVASEEGDGAAQEAGGGRCFLVGQHLGVGQAAVIVDGDVDELIADRPALAAGGVSPFRVVVLSAAADTRSVRDSVYA